MHVVVCLLETRGCRSNYYKRVTLLFAYAVDPHYHHRGSGCHGNLLSGICHTRLKLKSRMNSVRPRLRSALSISYFNQVFFHSLVNFPSFFWYPIFLFIACIFFLIPTQRYVPSVPTSSTRKVLAMNIVRSRLPTYPALPC